jgi:hypothetical protein
MNKLKIIKSIEMSISYDKDKLKTNKSSQAVFD